MYVDHNNLGLPSSPNSSTDEIKPKDDSLVQLKYMSLTAACKAVITALKEELGKAWTKFGNGVRNLMAFGVKKFNYR